MSDFFEILAVGMALCMIIAPVFLFVIVMRFIGMKERTRLHQLEQAGYEQAGYGTEKQ